MAPRSGAYRIKVTIRFKVRRREKFVGKIKKPTIGLKEYFYSGNASVGIS